MPKSVYSNIKLNKLKTLVECYGCFKILTERILLIYGACNNLLILELRYRST